MLPLEVNKVVHNQQILFICLLDSDKREKFALKNTASRTARLRRKAFTAALEIKPQNYSKQRAQYICGAKN